MSEAVARELLSNSDNEGNDRGLNVIPNSDNDDFDKLSLDIDINLKVKNNSNMIGRHSNSKRRSYNHSNRSIINSFRHGYVNGDIIEENENSSSTNDSQSSSGSKTNTQPTTTIKQLALKPQPPIPETIGEIKLRRRQKTIETIKQDNNLISELLNNIVNKGNVRDNFFAFCKIGRGATCSVYKAINRKTSELVAIKAMNIENYLKKELLTELSILSNKNISHANVIKYYESYLFGNQLWIVMEYIELPLNKLAQRYHLNQFYGVIMKEILKGLEFLHQNDIIHRDLKSNNVLLGSNGEIKIIDFGFSAQLKYLDEKKYTPIGNGFFRSPEISRREAYDKKTDIWSLGIILYEMIEGEPPNFDQTASYAAEIILKEGKPKVNFDEMSKEFADFYNKCLDPNPDERFTASQLLEHEFLKSTSPTSSLLPIIRQCIKQNKN